MFNPVWRINYQIVRTINILTTILLLELVLNVTPTWACSCFPLRSPNEEMNESTAVFSGQVIRINIPDHFGGMRSVGNPLTATFTVYKIWKGPHKNPIVIQTTRDSASCGYNFEVGQEYLVYSYGSPSNLQTNICTRTTSLDNANVDLQAIGSSVEPPPFKDQSNFLSMNQMMIISILLLLVVLVAFSVVGFHRLRSENNSS